MCRTNRCSGCPMCSAELRRVGLMTPTEYSAYLTARTEQHARALGVSIRRANAFSVLTAAEQWRALLASPRGVQRVASRAAARPAPDPWSAALRARAEGRP